MTTTILTSIIATVGFVLGYLAHNEKDKQKMKTEVMTRLKREEVDKLIDLKLKPVEVEMREIKKDGLRIEKKIDLIVSAIMKSK